MIHDAATAAKSLTKDNIWGTRRGPCPAFSQGRGPQLFQRQVSLHFKAPCRRRTACGWGLCLSGMRKQETLCRLILGSIQEQDCATVPERLCPMQCIHTVCCLLEIHWRRGTGSEILRDTGHSPGHYIQAGQTGLLWSIGNSAGVILVKNFYLQIIYHGQLFSLFCIFAL